MTDNIEDEIAKSSHKLSQQEIKQIELNILIEFDRICRKHKLQYMLACGTLLGAVRHGGFIPWDDDIDVYMPRRDYERLYIIMSSDEPCKYKLTSSRNSSSVYQFFKLIDPQTLTFEKYIGNQYKQSLWIDIFPLDRYAKGEKRAKAIERKLTRLLWKRSFKLADPSVGSNALIRAAKILGKRFTSRANLADLNAEIDKLSQSFNDSRMNVNDSSNAYWWPGATMPNEHYPQDILFPVSHIQFEGYDFYAPAKPTKYLDLGYGDWRTPPSPEERFVHFPDVYYIESDSIQRDHIGNVGVNPKV